MIKIKIDNRIAFKGEPGEWKKRPPDEFKDAIDPRTPAKPWMKAILIAMADAIYETRSTTITAHSKLKGIKSGWSVEVVLT